MPSTAWNVFVASGVAVVVYFGVRMGEVLPALVAGTLLFVGGWMTGYAINRGAPVSIPRMLTAGGICGFVIVWTLLIRQGEYLVGAAVIALVSFAAWVTSEMGPLKGDEGPTSPIDEPKPPAGPRPGTPVDLGGEPDGTAPSGSDGGLLGGVHEYLSPAGADAPEGEAPASTGSGSRASDSPGPDGPAPDELHDRPPADGDGPAYSSRAPDEPVGGRKESIFGLGIFYEGDPEGPRPAGANAEPSSTAAEPKDGDHTRPGAVSEPGDPEGEPQPSENGMAGDDADGAGSDDGPVKVDLGADDDTEAADGEPDEPAAGEAREPAEAAPVQRLREPLNSPRRPGKSPEVETGEPRRDQSATDIPTTAPASDPAEGETPGRATDGEPGSDWSETDPKAASRSDRAEPAEADGAELTEEHRVEAGTDEPPAEHRVEIEDDGGFQFG